MAKSAADIPGADILMASFVGAVTEIVRGDVRDPSARQLAVFVHCYLTDGEHTVRGMAEHFKVSKPAITRALDRLEELDWARRKVDPKDRRSIFVQRTLKGTAYLRELRGFLGAAAKAAAPGRKTAA